MVPMIEPIAWPPSAGARVDDDDLASEPGGFERRRHAGNAGADARRCRLETVVDSACGRTTGRVSAGGVGQGETAT